MSTEPQMAESDMHLAACIGSDLDIFFSDLRTLAKVGRKLRLARDEATGVMLTSEEAGALCKALQLLAQREAGTE